MGVFTNSSTYLKAGLSLLQESMTAKGWPILTLTQDCQRPTQVLPWNSNPEKLQGSEDFPVEDDLQHASNKALMASAGLQEADDELDHWDEVAGGRLVGVVLGPVPGLGWEVLEVVKVIQVPARIVIVRRVLSPGFEVSDANPKRLWRKDLNQHLKKRRIHISLNLQFIKKLAHTF